MARLKIKQTRERNVLEDLLITLTPFQKVTDHIQGNNIVTYSLVIPCISALSEQDTHRSCIEFAHYLYEAVMKRLSKCAQFSKFMTTLVKIINGRTTMWI